jgi:signal peptidase II
MSRVAGQMLVLLLVLSTVGCDRVTKHLATTNLRGLEMQSYLAGFLQLEYVRNPGAFLSIGTTLPEPVRVALFTVGAGVLLMVVGFIAIKDRWAGLPLAGVALTLAGGASNLIDRILHGSVVDFMSIGIGSVRTGIFNVADIAILLGGALIVAGHRRLYER